MKKREKGKLSSKKNKKEGLFGKENLKWGLGEVVIFSLVSVVLLNIPCKLSGPLPFSFCLNTLIFGLINIFGGLIGGILGLSSHSNFRIIYRIFRKYQRILLDFLYFIILLVSIRADKSSS